MEIKRIIAIGMMACVGIAVWRMGAMQEQMGVDNLQSEVIFKPSSGRSITAPLNMVRLFGTIDNMLIDIPEEGQIEVSMSETTLRKLLKDLQWVLNLQRAYNYGRRMTPEQVHALGSRVRAQRAEKEARAMAVRIYTPLYLETLIASYNAAVYLDSPELIQKYACEIAGMVTSDEALKVLAQNNPALVALISDNSINQNVKRVIFRYMPQTWIEFSTRDQQSVSSVAISADGNTVVAGSHHGTAKIVQWTGSEWEEQYTIVHSVSMATHSLMIDSVAISALDGNRVVTGSLDGTAKIVQRHGSQWAERYAIRDANAIKSVAISADGNTVVMGLGRGANIVKWNGSEWQKRYTIPHQNIVESVAISADGNTVVTGTGETAKIVKLYEFHWEEQYTIPHVDSIKSVAISANGNTVVTRLGRRAKIVKWNGSEWEEQYSIRHEARITSVAISADGNTVVTGSVDETAKIVKLNGSQWAEQYTIWHEYAIESVAISADGNTVVTGSYDETAKIVKLNGSQWEERYTIRHEKAIRSVAISADGNTVVTGSYDGMSKIVRLSPADTFDQALLLRLCAWKKKHGRVRAWHTGWVKSVMDTLDAADQERIKREFGGEPISNNNNQ
jgi:WD40 repeat protein